MAAFSLAFKHLLSPPLLSVLPRPPAVAVSPLSAVRFPRTTTARAYGSDPSQNGWYTLRTWVDKAAGTCEQREVFENENSVTNSDVKFFNFADKFTVVCGTRESQKFPPLHHECWVEEVRDGYRVQLYMAGVGKDKLKVQIMNPMMMVVQGTKPTDLDGEDHAKTAFWYGILGPPDANFTHSACKAEINDGLLKLFVPKCSPN